MNNDILSGLKISQFDIGYQGNYNFKNTINFN